MGKAEGSGFGKDLKESGTCRVRFRYNYTRNLNDDVWKVLRREFTAFRRNAYDGHFGLDCFCQ